MKTAHLAIAGACALALGVSAAAADELHHWGYQGEGGPSHWSAMSPENAACSTGKTQSPIDINTGKLQRKALPAIAFHYKPAPLRIIDNGHTVQVGYAPG